VPVHRLALHIRLGGRPGSAARLEPDRDRPDRTRRRYAAPHDP
jgi:hypothetical protein